MRCVGVIRGTFYFPAIILSLRFFFCFSNWKIRYISFKPILCTDVGELIHLSQLASVFIKLTVVHKLQKS